MKLLRSLMIAILMAFTGCQTLWADGLDSIRWRAEIAADFSDGPHNPFWFNSNRHGLSSIVPNSGYVSLGAFKEADKERRFSWEAGAEIAVPWNFTSKFVLQQLYGQINYRSLSLLVGSRDMTGPISDPELSSGNLVFSGNARPIPQIRAGIFDYADVWGLQGWLAVKGYVAYGKFTDSKWAKSWIEPGQRYNTGVLYCSRGIWIRNGNPERFPLTLECGLQLETQFGGDVNNWGHDKRYMKMPSNFKAFVKAFIPMHGEDDENLGEVQNIQGNMLGAWNFALNWKKYGSDWSLKAYYQHLFEDHSMLYIQYPWKDGLYGFEGVLPSNRFISKVVYEYVYTKDQSGSVNTTPSADLPGDAPGADDYFNNYIYTGWSHWGMSIGTPLFLSPIYNNPHELEFLHNRIIAHHIGVSGDPLPTLSWRVLMSFVSSWGTYNRPSREVAHLYSGLAEVSWRPEGKLIGWEGKVGIGIDRGLLAGHNTGVSLSISKTGFFKFR